MKRWIVLLCLLLIGSLAWGQDFIPPQAFEHRDTIKKELDNHFPGIPRYNYIPALIEHESCQHLRHKRCWRSTSSFKTSREEGAGLGMITRAYRPDGSLRFDSLTEMRTRYRRELSDLSWSTIYQRPDVQIRVIVLMTRDNFGRLYDVKDPMERLTMTNVAYNGGLGGLQRERRLCGLTKGCNANVWFGHVERHCLKSKKILYGKRTVCDVNRDHTSDVLLRKLPKYERAKFIRL